MKKNIFVATFVVSIINYANAQSDKSKNDSILIHDYGMRIYDARLGNYMAIDPKQTEKNNPYNNDSKNVVIKDSVVVVNQKNKKVKSK